MKILKIKNYLNDKNLSNNTIFIFMTDNGTSGGAVLDDKVWKKVTMLE